MCTRTARMHHKEMALKRTRIRTSLATICSRCQSRRVRGNSSGGWRPRMSATRARPQPRRPPQHPSVHPSIHPSTHMPYQRPTLRHTRRHRPKAPIPYPQTQAQGTQAMPTDTGPRHPGYAHRHRPYPQTQAIPTDTGHTHPTLALYTHMCSCIPDAHIAASLHPCNPASLHHCILAPLHPCIPASLHPCIPASRTLMSTLASHVLTNLPATGLTLNDAFRGIPPPPRSCTHTTYIHSTGTGFIVCGRLAGLDFSKVNRAVRPIVHCYCFATSSQETTPKEE